MVELPFSLKIKFVVVLIAAIFALFTVEMYVYNSPTYFVFLPVLFSVTWVVGLYVLKNFVNNFLLSFLFAVVILYIAILILFSANIDFYEIGNLSKAADYYN